MTLEERIESLEKENKELREQLRKVAELTFAAYNNITFARQERLPDEVKAIATKYPKPKNATGGAYPAGEGEQAETRRIECS